jgi:hypothetical protein
MRKALTLTICIISILWAPFLSSKVNAQEDITITIEEGAFVLKNLSLISEKYLGPKLKGEVLNNTSKDWKEVTFEINLYDNSGNKLKGYVGESFSFTIYGIKKGETKSIGYGSGESFLGIRDVSISKYEINFKTGEYPANYIFTMTKPKVSNDLLYEDNFLKILFSISKRQIGFNLKNKTANPIKIDWNQVSYVDVLGESHKVMHSGVKYIDREKPQSPSVIPPTAKLEDIVFPTDYIYYSSGKYGGWREIPLFPEAPKAKIYKGRTFSVFMPLEINGVVKNYLFSFNIEEIEF